MNAEQIISEIGRYEKELAGILSRFTHARNDIHIGDGDDPIFRQYVRELVDLFDDVNQNSYSSQIANEFNDGISNFIGSPSYKSVENILSLVRAALTRFNRKPELLAPRKAEENLEPTNGAVANFLSAYDELSDEVARAKHQFFAEHLANWFSMLDESSQVGPIIARLQNGLDVQTFLKDSEATIGSMVGSGTLQWPKDREQRLGMKLLLFREMAEGRIEPWDFAHNYTYGGSNLDDNVRELTEQIFSPMARELRRQLETRVGAHQQRLSGAKTESAPASDRIVQLDHNSVAYKDTVDALDRLEKTLREANDYPDPEEKEQRVAEISAGRKLLTAVRVRIAAIIAVLATPLTYLATKFVDSGIGVAAKTAWEKLTVLFGAIF